MYFNILLLDTENLNNGIVEYYQESIDLHKKNTLYKYFIN